MRFYRPVFLARIFYPEGIFRLKARDKALCLTFDDGPESGSTERILDLLDLYHVKAIFFCTGEAAGKSVHLIDKIRSAGHIVGNHGFNHFNGFHTRDRIYLENAEKANSLTSDLIYRPPYGRLRLSQYRSLRKKYTLVFWDIMPYDFDARLSCEKSLQILKRKLRPGSVIVFHDTPTSYVHSYLEEFIRHALSLGYRFDLPVI